MSVKGGQIITVGNLVLLDRIQTGGPGQININEEKVYELGNFSSVGYVTDIPDLTYSVESLDAAPEFEALITGGDYASDAAGTKYDLKKVRPIDVVGQFKKGQTDAAPYEVDGCAVAPYLLTDSLSYRFGLRDNGSQSGTMRGDGLFYSGGSAYIEEFTGTASANQVCTLAHTALPYNGDVISGARYALGVSLDDGTRLRLDVDYTETATAVTILAAVPVTDKIRITYVSATVASYAQSVHAVESATRPAAIRGRNIRVYVNGQLWTDVQSVNLDWRITLDKDEEFGNDQVIGQDFDVPDVSGTITVKPRDVAALFDKLQTITGVADADTEVLGALQRSPMSVRVVLYSPSTGVALKTLSVPDAKLTLPGYSGRVQTKSTWDFQLTSQGGTLNVYKGAVSAPTVTALDDATGVAAGGETVTLTGTDFVDVTAVKFDTTDATSFTVVSDTEIIAVSPAHASGATNITVTTISGTSAIGAGNAYTYS